VRAAARGADSPLILALGLGAAAVAPPRAGAALSGARDELRWQVGGAAQRAQRRCDLLGAAEQVGDLLGLLHRRLDAVEPELVGRLLGGVDDVVERDALDVAGGLLEQRQQLRVGLRLRRPHAGRP
jgi:hypothetical protein